MVTTRSGTTTRQMKSTHRALHEHKYRERKPLLKRHLRRGGSNEHHECSVCHTKMYVTNNCNLISQCPACNDAIHSTCLVRWIKTCDTIATCPNCRMIIPGIDETTVYTEQIYNDWEARCTPWDSDDASVSMSIETTTEYDEDESIMSDDNSAIHTRAYIRVHSRLR